jgi:F-box/leucine-rich repeat protein 10/11
MLRKSWLDDTYESDLPAEISPDVFYGPDREPIIVPKSRGGFESLGGKVPSHENFGIDDVVKLVGKDYMVDVIGKSQVACQLDMLIQRLPEDVATQASSKWSLAQWAYYFKTDIPPSGDSRHSTSHNKHLDLDNMAAPQKVYNVISLECTGTELAKLVRPPRLVKELDWVDNCWPDIKKKRKSSHPNLDPRSAKGETHAVDVSHSASYTLDPRNRDDPMAGTANSVEQRSDALGDDSVAGKRKLDGDGWPKVKLYCLMGKAGSWTVSRVFVFML